MPLPKFSGEDVSIKSIVEQLRSTSSEVIIDGLKTLGHVSEAKNCDFATILPYVILLMKSSDDEDVRYEAARVIGKIKDPDAIGELIFAIRGDSSEKVKEGAVRALGFIKDASCFDYLSGLAADIWEQSIRVRRAAVFSIGHLDHPEVISVLRDILVNDPDSDVRVEAAESMSVCFLKMEKVEVSVIAKTILSQIDHRVESASDVRMALINALTVAEDPACIDDLIAVLKNDPSPRVRGQAANALAHFFDPRVEKALLAALTGENEGIKKRVALAVAYYATRNPLSLHDEMCEALIYIQKIYPRDSYIWKEAIRALPAC